MTPSPFRWHNLEDHEPPASISASAAKAMHIRLVWGARSVEASSSGGLAKDTLVFIVVGVVCLLLLLIGFYLVSRPRVPSNFTTSVPHSPSAANAHPQRPRGRRDRSESWKIWKISLRSSHPTTSDPPISQVSPDLTTIPTPFPIAPSRTGSRDHHHKPALVASRPRQIRRVTSPSIQTDFSHSHISQEALHDYHAWTYDLDGDLVIEMLHSARDDVGPRYPIGWGSDHASVDEPVDLEPRSIVTLNIEGGVGGSTALPPAAQLEGVDYESSGASFGDGNVTPLTGTAEPVGGTEGKKVEVEDTEREALQ